MQSSYHLISLWCLKLTTGTYRAGTKEWPLNSTRTRVLFEFYHILWDIITLNKPILVKIKL